MILAKEYEGELWIKASLHNREVKRAVEAEREACAALCFRMWNEWLDSSVGDDFLDTSITYSSEYWFPTSIHIFL